MSREIIYSCRYDSKVKSAGRWHRFMLPKSIRFKYQAECDELIRKVKEESEYIPIPERLSKVNDLISTAKEIANIFEINMDIVQLEDGIDFNFYYDSGLFVGECKEYFGKMFFTCDNVTVYTPKKKKRNLPRGCNGIINMTYYTHRHLVAGKELNQS